MIGLLSVFPLLASGQNIEDLRNTLQQRLDGPREQHIPLTALGESNGVVFSGMAGERSLFFPLPPSVPISGSRLILNGDFRQPFAARAAIELSVDGIPRAARRLQGDSGAWRIDQAVTVDQAERFLRADLRYSAVLTDDRCSDQRVAGPGLNVSADSGLRLRYDPADVADIRSALALLPESLTIVMPRPPLAAPVYEGAWRLARTLIADGHELDFKTVPDPAGDMAPETALILRAAGLDPTTADHDARLGAWLLSQWSAQPNGLLLVSDEPGLATARRAARQLDSALRPDRSPSPEDGDADGNLHLVHLFGQPFVALTAPDPLPAGRLLALPYTDMLTDTRFEVAAARVPGTEDDGWVSLSDLGIRPGNQQITQTGSWNMGFALTQLPAGRPPVTLVLELLAGHDTGDSPPIAAVYLNDFLIATQQLEEPGRVSRFSVALPDGLVVLNNTLRVELQRQTEAGDCRLTPQSYPAELLPGSGFRLTPAKVAAVDFFELAADLSPDAPFVIPPDYLDRPLQTLPLLTRLAAGLALAPNRGRLEIADQTYTPDQPFVAVGVALPDDVEAPVQLNRGRVVVTGSDGVVLLDLNRPRDSTLAQLARVGDISGLWLPPTSANPPQPSSVTLERGDVAFINDGGVTAAFSSKRNTMFQVTYPDQAGWRALLNRYRLWVYVALWLALTAGFVMLLQRLYRSRRSQ